MASEVIFDSEVYRVSEVAPCGAVANLTSLCLKEQNFTVKQLHFCIAKTSSKGEKL